MEAYKNAERLRNVRSEELGADPQSETQPKCGMVLLKNQNGLLPLSNTRPLMLGVTGPNADQIGSHLGEKARKENCVTIRKGLKRFLRDSFIQLEYHPGCLFFDEDPQMRMEGVETMRHCDVIIAALGGEGPELPDNQLALLEQLHKTGKPVVTVLVGGQPTKMRKIAEWSDAIVCCAYPEFAGGEALARLLFGAAEI